MGAGQAMRRRIYMVAIFLLAGAVVNVAVAWGCAILIQLMEPGRGALPRVEASLREREPDGSWYFWEILRSKDRGVLLYHSFWDARSEDIIYYDVSTELRPDELAPSWASLRTPPDTDYEVRWVHGLGWPVVSMWRDYGLVSGGTRYELLHGLGLTFLPPDVSLPRAVPLHPIWPGFVINTIFYAAVVWLLIPGPFVLRRFIRVKRGRCVKCGYPSGESAVCSECGKTLPRRGCA